ncbi:c-type cytochrome [Opitutia bacterium ISCC 51]|nr:c-type cytochrome [Opitutae bacterium ISCC 51]QXD27615.1 c-type cytochrome [Opitutae bacterium ISCC 52]
MLPRTFSIILPLFIIFVVAGCSKQSETSTSSAAETDTTEEVVASKDAPRTHEADSQDIQYIKWTPELNIPDPVAISFDDRGRAYVTQTRRRRANDLDIRRHTDWIVGDISLNSVEEKESFFRTQMAPSRAEENKDRIIDYNEDGYVDWRDLTFYNERIYLVEDTDNDGFADSSKIYYEDFKTLVTGVAAGVLWHEGDVYATVAPDVWKFRDTDGDDIPDKKEVLATGFGLHIAYGGHDMHGLIVGPDGKIYWSIGDKGLNVVSKEGTRFFYPNQGAVLRANPDGSDFEVFARGLRNVQEPAFDEYGNWFGVDNDSDQTGETERFMYIVDGMDAGWRNDYQYRGDGYNPWMDEKMTIPYHKGQAAYIVPTIRNYVDGPAGFVKNPGTALNERYKDYFFLNATMNGAQYAFQVEQDGASFRMVNDHQIGEGLPLIGLTWGNDGALYTPDWGGGYPMNETGAIWKLDTPGGNQAIRAEVEQLLQEGMAERSVPQLRELLSHADQRIRLNAQFELVKRNEIDSLAEDSQADHQLKSIHAVWGLGQLARAENETAINQLLKLLDAADPEIQVQASKALGDLKPGSFNGQVLIPLLDSPHPRVRFQAALSIGQQGVSEAFNKIVSMIEATKENDTYMRHAGVVSLEGIGGAETLLDHASEQVRLSAVVALRRLVNPSVADFLMDSSELVVTEAARAIHDDFSIEEALPILARHLVSNSSNNEALVRRLINANFRIGGENEAYQVAEYADNNNNAAILRIDALDALANWKTPPPLDRVDGRRRYFKDRSVTNIGSIVKGKLENLLNSENSEILEKAVSAANNLSVTLSPVALEKLLRNNQAPGSLRVEALKSLQDPKNITYAQNSGSEDLRMAAASFLLKTNKESAANFLATRLSRSRSLTEKQKAIAMLAEIGNEIADREIKLQFEQLELGTLNPGLQLDILEAANARDMTSEIAAFEATRPQESSLAGYIETLEGGSIEAGKAIANTHLAAQCARCHKFKDGRGSEIGPNLKDIGAIRDKEYILRSLVEPGADIAEGFGMTTVSLKNGESITAQLGKETDSGIELVDLEGNRQMISSADIESRTEPMSSMPPMGLILNKRELRDVMAYLSSLK